MLASLSLLVRCGRGATGEVGESYASLPKKKRSPARYQGSPWFDKKVCHCAKKKKENLEPYHFIDRHFSSPKRSKAAWKGISTANRVVRSAYVCSVSLSDRNKRGR